MKLFGGKEKLLNEGKRYLNMQLLDEAIKQLARSIEKKENLPEAYYYSAAASFLKTDMESAKKYLHLLVGLNPDENMKKIMCDLTGMRKLVSDKHRNSFPSFSRDGKKIVFASSRRKAEGSMVGNNSAIYMVDVDTAEEAQVTGDEYDNYNPGFSPDGKKIVFLSRRRDTNDDGIINNLDYPGVYTINIDGTDEKCVVQDVFFNKYPSFSPDGRQIVFSSWRGSSNSGIYIINSDGSRENQIVTDAYDNTFPSFSPTGGRILYTSWRHDTNGDGRIDFRDNSSIYTVDIDGKNEHQIVSHKYNNSFPMYSPDGLSIMFLSTRRDTNRDGKINSLDNNNIFICNVTGKGEKCVSSDKFYNKIPTFSHDGSKVAFLSGGSSKARGESKGFFSPKGVYMADSNGKNRVQLLSDKYYGSNFVLFSPVDNRVVYMSFRKGTSRGIYIMDISKPPSLEEVRGLIDNLSQ